MWLICVLVMISLDELECELEEALREFSPNKDVHTNTEEPTDTAPQEAPCWWKRKHNSTNEPEAKAALLKRGGATMHTLQSNLLRHSLGK